MKVLVLGNKGMLGSEIEKVFVDDGYDVIGVGRDVVDVTDKEMVEKVFVDENPDVVINCTGYTDVEKAEDDEVNAFKVNGEAVGILARMSRKIDALFVHFSTDYVFDGEKQNGYDEDDAPNPINVYGHSKKLGEDLIFDEMEFLNDEFPKEGNFFIIRTSWLFGKNGKNFVSTMLRLAETKNELKVVNDQIGNPTYAVDLANQTKWLVTSNEYPSGIYHITNDNAVSWYDFAREIFSLTNANVNVLPCASDEYVTKAKRPKFSSLNNNKIPPLRDFKEALRDYLSTI